MATPQQHWNPAAHQQPPGQYLPIGLSYPPAPRRTGLMVGLVVSAVLAIGATTTAIVLATSAPSTSSPAPVAGPASGADPGGAGGGIAPVVGPSTGGAGAGGRSADPPPITSRAATGGGDSGNVDSGDDDSGDGSSGTNGGVDPNGNGGNGSDTDTGGNPDGGGGTGDRPTGDPASIKNDILQSAIGWIDARNSGDGNRTLQLGCSDDITAVQSGQANPAASAGYSAYRPTGEVIGHSSGLAAYVVISSQNLQTGATQPSRLPIVWEQGAWRMCYYPGVETNRITGG